MNELEQMRSMIAGINQEAQELREIFKPAEEITKQIAIIESSEEQDDQQLVYLYSKLEEFIKEAEPYDISREEFIMWLHRIK